MSKIILLTGDLAAGKTTFSEQLAERYHLPLFNKDHLKETLDDNITTVTREENLELSRASFAIFIYILKESIKADVDVIFESNFKDEELLIIEEIIHQGSSTALLLIFSGDILSLHQRYLKRALENRHPVHLSVDFSLIEDFEEYILQRRNSVRYEKTICINCSDFSYVNDEKLLTGIDNFYQNK